MNPVVVEWRKKILLKGVPQTELDGNPTAEPLQDVEAVGSFRSRSKPNKVPWGEVVEKRLVALCCSVMELVNDDYVEVGRREPGDFACRNRLDGCEYMVPLLWVVPSNP